MAQNNTQGVTMEWRLKLFTSKAFEHPKNYFPGFMFLLYPCGILINRIFFPELFLPIKSRMHICPCSLAVGICKKIWIQTYFGPMTVDSVENFRHFAF